MPLSNLLHAATGTCRFCHRKAGIIARAHRDYQETFQVGWTEMVNLAAAARTHTFDEKSPQNTLADISQRYYGNGTTVNQTLEAGQKLGVDHAMANGITSQHEETHLRPFRDQLALNPTAAADCKRRS